MKYLICLAALALAACGGGGGTPTPPVSNPVVTLSANQKMVSAWIDYRFDEPLEINANGIVMTSYDGMTPMIDHIKKVGYNTIVLQTQVPVNPQTGLIDPYENPNQPRLIPADIWRVVDYAKSQGLVVWVMIAITDGYDNELTNSITGPAFSSTAMFNTVTDYDTKIATLAQQHRVDGIYVGDFQIGFDNASYTAQWKTLVASVKNVFNGKLSYAGGYDNVVYDLVDYVSVGFNWPLLSTTTTDVATIVNAYYNNTQGINIVNYAENLSALHGNKPLILDTFRSTPVDTGVGLTVDIWAALAKGQNLSNLPAPNYNLQVAKISAFCSISSKITPVVGIGFDEYMPWAQAAWVQNATPGSANYNWHLFDTLGFELYNHTPAETAINQCAGTFK
jgi:hypothetical protein